MTDMAELHRQHHDAQLELERSNHELEKLRAQVHTEARVALTADPEMARLARARAWLDHDPDKVIAMDLSNLPDEFPPTVEDPSTYVAAFISAHATSAVSRIMDTPADEKVSASPSSPSVARLQEIVGGLHGN